MARKPKTNSTINGNEYFRTRLQVGIDSKGKSIMKNFYGTTKTEALNKKDEYIRDVENGLNPDLGSQTLNKAINSWLWNIEKHSGNKSSTFERYESITRNYIIDSSLGQLVVSDIKKMPIQIYYKSLIEEGKTYSMIANINKLLNKFFRYAAGEGYIIINPLDGLKLPKDDEKVIDEDFNKIETLTDEELNKIIKPIGDAKLRYIIMFASLTGCRMGEILALQKSDVKDSVAKINKSIRNVKIFKNKNDSYWEERITTPKTKSSNREVPIPEILQKELKRLDILVKKEKLKLGPAYTDNELLFPSTTGTNINSRNLRRSWERALKDADIEYKKFHSLRHTYATKLIENGVSILTVSRLLGHSSIKTTEIYLHVLEDVKAKEVECLNSMFTL